MPASLRAPEPRSIVILNDFAFVDGGASKIALGSAVALARRGHRVLLFTAVGPVASELQGVPGLTVVCLDRYEIVEDPQRARAARNGLWNRSTAAALRQQLAGFRPADTLVHLHTWTKALSASVVRAAVDLGFPVVLTLHDYFSACPTGSFFIHPTQSLCPLTPLSPACLRTQCDSRSYTHKLWRAGRQWIGEHAGRLPSGISAAISISTLSEDILRPYLPASAPVYRVPNFIAVKRQPAAEVEANSRFCFVGRLSPEKGPLLAAACGQSLGVEMRFVGSGPLQAQIEAAAPASVCTGWLPPEKVHTELAGCRALVFPSLWYETQGLVVAEAAALGVPAIVASASAAREWVKDGVTGLLFQSGDARDLAAKMSLLRDRPGLAKALGQAAYERYWSDPATLDRHCESLESVYSQVLAARKRQGSKAVAA